MGDGSATTRHGSRRLRRGEEAHEEGELLDVADRAGSRGGIHVRRVVGHRPELAGFFAFLRKELVADALLDVVGFAGEHQERFVLSFPPEARDRSVVAVSVRVAGRKEPLRTAPDPERGPGRGAGRVVGEDRGVGDRLDQAEAERRCGNPEAYVLASDVGLKVLLVNGAAGGVAGLVAPAADDEERVHATVAATVGLVLEAGLAHRPVFLDERWDNVPRSHRGRHPDLGIDRGTRPAEGRLGVAADTAVEVETRTEAVTDALDFDEGVPAGSEERLLGRGEGCEAVAGPRGSTADTGVASRELRRSRTRSQYDGADRQDQRACLHPALEGAFHVPCRPDQEICRGRRHASSLGRHGGDGDRVRSPDFAGPAIMRCDGHRCPPRKERPCSRTW